MDYTPTRTGNGDDDDRRQDRAGESGVQGRDTSGPTTDEAMTRSEEQLHVGTEQQETGKARLRKHIVTETETVQAPVSREEVRVEREPITEANRGQAMAGGDLTEEEHEVTLTEERAVVTKEAVPVERVPARYGDGDRRADRHRGSPQGADRRRHRRDDTSPLTAAS